MFKFHQKVYLSKERPLLNYYIPSRLYSISHFVQTSVFLDIRLKKRTGLICKLPILKKLGNLYP